MALCHEFGFAKSFPLFFRLLLLLIFALYYILKGNFEPVFLPIISFLKTFVAENVAKSVVGWCRVVVRYITAPEIRIQLFLLYKASKIQPHIYHN